MKRIWISYVGMLVVCLCIGVISAFMHEYHRLWGILFVFPALGAWVALPELRSKIPSHPEWSSAFLVVSFAVLVVAWVAVILSPMRQFDSFTSVMSVISISAAFLMTIGLIMFIPNNDPLKKKFN